MCATHRQFGVTWLPAGPSQQIALLTDGMGNLSEGVLEECQLNSFTVQLAWPLSK